MDRVCRALMVVACSAALGGIGCGQSKSKAPGPDMTGVAGQALHIVSTPVNYAQVGQDLKYQAVLSQPGAADWALMAAPQGAKIDQGGSLTWTPGTDQAGEHDISVDAVLAGQHVTQTVHVTAASTVMQASAHVDPANANGALIAVDAPLSPIQGTAVQIQPGALPPGNNVAVTISSMNNAPTPAAAKVAGVAPQDLRPVDFGPTGLAFQVPVKVHLPVTSAVLKKGRPEIQTYDYNTGRWQKIKVVAVDEANGFVVGEIKHFSTYVVTPPSSVFNLQLGLGGAGTACASALMVRPALSAAFDQIPSSSVNGYKGAAASVADVLAGLTAGQSLQIYTRVRAQAAAATGEQAAWVLASATRLGDGKIKVNVTTDSHGSAFLNTPAELDDGDSELAAWLSGGRVDLIFAGLGALDGGATADAEVSFYLVPASDADHPPPAAANPFGTDEVTQAMLTAMTSVDDDCDSAPNQWDAIPQGTPPPQLSGLPLPPGPVHVVVGGSAPFKVSANQTGVTFSWTASDPSVAIASAMSGAVGAATPGQPGFFSVDVVGSNGMSSSRLHWDLIADPPSVQMANTPPFVAIGASAATVRAGERVVLTAYGKDAEQTDLTFAWYADDASTLSAQLGSSVVFAPTTPGDYKIGCIANDGFVNSTPAAVIISVLSPTANRPPEAPVVAPASVVLQHAAGAPVSVTLQASATDPDGDAVTYDFVPDRFTPPSFMLTKNGAGAAFATADDGLYLFYVTAQDSHGAVSPWTPVKIQVMPTLPSAPVDADKDGYPAGIDCNDNDPTIYPGAKGICGDGIDHSCSGHVLGKDDCDADGDRFSINQGDCDDTNPNINPAAIERCDGVDDNCNGIIDEGFGVGADCTAGVGACAVAATTICNAAHNGITCGGNPATPQPEVCDGIDNDCNGIIDDVPGAAASSDVNNCGSCNVHCAAPANEVVACLKGGCSSTCAPGWVDTDHNPANGCECQLTNGGVEICDGIDNDCNGLIDDGVGMVFYDGPAGTQGLGVCAAGARLCQKGQFVTVRAEQVPRPEICDGLDDDCNGKVDDGFDLANDPRNCGACGVVCPDGKCAAGKCAGGIIGIGGADGGTGGAGGAFGADGGVRDGGTGVPPASMLVVCPCGAGSVCVDINYDPANCGACGKACPAGAGCYGGVCQSGPTGTFDGGVSAGDGSAGAPDAGATNPPPTCDATKPMVCQNSAGMWLCADPQSDPLNCGGCGRTCPAGVTCTAGACGNGTAACAPPLSACGASCTTLGDDPANCGVCGTACPGGVCAAAMCQPAGPGKYSDPCKANTDCGAGMMCMDETRFGWPMGFCSTPCDAAARGCAAGQACVNVGAKLGGFGLCESKCGVDADCPRGYLCGAGICAPDCRTSTKICLDGQMCDPTGRCVASTGVPTTCAAPMILCTTAMQGTYCTDPTRDPANCGGCGRVCGAGMYCNAGVCQSSGGGPTAPGIQACPGTNGAPVCTNIYSDSANCGSCGHNCTDGTYCQGGMCLPPPTCPAGNALCTDAPTGKSYCTDVTVDSGNCGACGIVCQNGTICQGGTCVVGTATNCPLPGKMCVDQPTGQMYCAKIDGDPANCGGCGVVCPAGAYCQNYTCTVGGSTDGGTTQTCSDPMTKMYPNATGGYYCAYVLGDPGNCGACGNVCPAGSVCQNAICMPYGGDGGTTQPPTCADPTTKPCPTAVGGYFCASVQTDPANCGGCGFVCPAGSYCSNYSCIPMTGQDGGTAPPPDGGATCSSPMLLCKDPTGNPICVDPRYDNLNCGACGNVCQANAKCMNGLCYLP